MHNQDFEAYAELKKFNYTVSEPWDAALMLAMNSLNKPRDQISLLDYGCGDGKYFSHLIRRGLGKENVHGVEISSTRVSRCKELGWDNARLVIPNEAFPYPDEFFDIVNCMEVIEHIPQRDCAGVIQEIRRVLKPGGMLMISTPNYPIKRFYDLSDAVLHGKWSRLRDDPTHVTRFNHRTLVELLEHRFSRLEPQPFKQGYLYKRMRRPYLLHKLFFLCQA